MSKVEALLARLYSDAELRMRFLADPGDIAREAGLDANDAIAIVAIDREGLELAARSFDAKRASRPRRRWWRF